MTKWAKWAFAAAVAAPLFVTTSAFAADDYSVQPVQPDNQRTESVDAGYIDVKATPGSHQTLQFKLRNTSQKNITVRMVAGTAGTTDNGAVDYTTTDWSAQRFVGMTNQMQRYLKPDQTEWQLKAGQTVVATATLQVPAQAFTGRMAGGVSFIEDNQNRSKQTGDGLKVNATFKYSVAVLLSNNQEIPEGMLTLGGVKATQVNKHTVFAVNVKNQTPSFINALGMKTTVTGPDGLKFTRTQANMQMAPNTQFNWGIYTNGARLRTGDYRVETDTYWSKDGKRQYSFSGDKYTYHHHSVKTVHVTADQADKLNKSDYDLQMKSKMPVAYKVFIGILIVIAAAILWFVLLKKRQVTIQVIDMTTNTVMFKERARAGRMSKIAVTLPQAVRVIPNTAVTVIDETHLQVAAKQTYIEIEVTTLTQEG